jgi:hypothetical protein
VSRQGPSLLFSGIAPGRMFYLVGLVCNGGRRFTPAVSLAVAATA